MGTGSGSVSKVKNKEEEEEFKKKVGEEKSAPSNDVKTVPSTISRQITKLVKKKNYKNKQK